MKTADFDMYISAKNISLQEIGFFLQLPAQTVFLWYNTLAKRERGWLT